MDLTEAILNGFCLKKPYLIFMKSTENKCEGHILSALKTRITLKPYNGYNGKFEGHAHFLF